MYGRALRPAKRYSKALLRRLAQRSVVASLYSDDFTRADENPVTGLSQADPTNLKFLRVVGNRVFGTTTAAAGGSGPYNDSNGYKTGFGNDHEVEITIYKNPAAAGSPNLEIECLLRWSDTGSPRTTSVGTTSAQGYELNLQHAGSYWILAWFMEPGECTRSSSVPTPVSGDKIRARIVGNVISVYYRPVSTGIEALNFTFTDTTGAGGGALYTTGNPGIGTYVDNGGVLTDFGIEDVVFRAL